jgi:alkaline phosphatase
LSLGHSLSLKEAISTTVVYLLWRHIDIISIITGGRIDLAHHANDAYRALRDVVAFDDAVQMAMDLTNENDTLIMVTADHSHPFIMAGYSNLDNEILGWLIYVYVIEALTVGQ